jgi:hypothetical protein
LRCGIGACGNGVSGGLAGEVACGAGSWAKLVAASKQNRSSLTSFVGSGFTCLETDIPLSPGAEAETLVLVVEIFDAVVDLCCWKSCEESSQDDPAGDEECLQHRKPQDGIV